MVGAAEGRPLTIPTSNSLALALDFFLGLPSNFLKKAEPLQPPSTSWIPQWIYSASPWPRPWPRPWPIPPNKSNPDGIPSSLGIKEKGDTLTSEKVDLDLRPLSYILKENWPF